MGGGCDLGLKRRKRIKEEEVGGEGLERRRGRKSEG